MSRPMILRAVILLAVVAGLPIASSSTPIELGLTSGSSGNLSFSFLHNATGAVQTEDGADFFRGGSTQVIAGSITATWDDANLFTNLSSGTISVTGGADFAVTGGSLDFGVAAGALIGTIVTDTYGTFYFYNYAFSSGATPANGFYPADPNHPLHLWANNWDNKNEAKPSSGAKGIDLGLRLTVVPEPNTALLFGMCIVAIKVGARRRE